MSNTVSVILFDIGGVLVELGGVQTMLGWLDKSMTLDQLNETWLLSPVVSAFEAGRMASDEFARQIVEEMSLRVSPETFLHEFTYWPQGLFPGVVDVIDRIPSTYTTAILSNTNALHWPRLMDEMGLANRFDHYFASHLVGMIKPDQDIFEYIVAALMCEPEDILFMDDNWLNVKAAREFGLQAEVTKGMREAGQALIDYGVLTG